MAHGFVYSLSGRLYDFLDNSAEMTRYASIREEIIPKLFGKVLDAGCGTGRNFPYYPSNAEVTAVDSHHKMLEVARRRKSQSKASITLKKHNLNKLPFKDNTFDAVVATFVLCVNTKEEASLILHELTRVAKTGARLYFLEYVYPQTPIKKLYTTMTALFPFFLYGLRYNITKPLLEKHPSLTIEEKKLVYKDSVRLLVARKTA